MDELEVVKEVDVKCGYREGGELTYNTCEVEGEQGGVSAGEGGVTFTK